MSQQSTALDATLNTKLDSDSSSDRCPCHHRAQPEKGTDRAIHRDTQNHAAFDILSIDSSVPIIIGYHAGCPDGCGAAYIVSTVLRERFPGAAVECVPIGHAASKFASVVKPRAVVFSLDITPSLGDLDALRAASAVIIADHHAGEEETLQKLQAALPGLVNLSDFSSDECGVSLAARMVEGLRRFNPDVIAMLHKMDVFKHPLPAHLVEDINPFRAFMIQNGERNVTIDLVASMFEQYEKACRPGGACWR